MHTRRINNISKATRKKNRYKSPSIIWHTWALHNTGALVYKNSDDGKKNKEKDYLYKQTMFVYCYFLDLIFSVRFYIFNFADYKKYRKQNFLPDSS